MGTAVDRLTDYVKAKDCHTTPWADIASVQIAAADEQLQAKIGEIKLLKNRAETGGIKQIRSMEDMVPLLFAHTAYKSYPESWFTQGKWDKMNQWLDTVSSTRINVDVKDVTDVDTWIDRQRDAGNFLSVSSGTTGKCSLVPANTADRAFFRVNTRQAFTWATGIEPGNQFIQIPLSKGPINSRTDPSKTSIAEPFIHGSLSFPGEPITVGKVSKMIALRRAVADGTAPPADIAAFDATSAARQKDMEDAIKQQAENIIARRGENILINGMFATMYEVSEMVRTMGYAGKFTGDNSMMTAGGLKGAKLPPDYRERIFETFNLTPSRVYHFYSMQELNSQMPRCRADRYHVPPWLILLVLDRTGDNLIAPGKGEIEGRAAFLDLSLNGRWGGLITGDKVSVDYGKCACGAHGPTVHHQITRYSETQEGDKITCAGTIDAYIRGVA
jgi:hypothetical protein